MLTRVRQQFFTEQQTGENCSAYALSNVMRYHGLHLDPESFYEKCLKDETTKMLKGGVTPETMMEQFMMLAWDNKEIGEFLRHHALGWKAESNLDEIKQCLEADLPVIVVGLADKRDKRITDNLHYMVVTGLDDENVYLLDSSQGDKYGERIDFYNRVVSRADFLEMWKIDDCKCGRRTLGQLANNIIRFKTLDNIIFIVSRT